MESLRHGYISISVIEYQPGTQVFYPEYFRLGNGTNEGHNDEFDETNGREFGLEYWEKSIPTKCNIQESFQVFFHSTTIRRPISEQNDIDETKLIQKYLKSIPFSYDTFNNKLITSIERNYISIVQMLLPDSRVDPSNNDNEAFEIAVEYGQEEIVKLLLLDSRVDPASDNNCSIREAAENVYQEIVENLIADSRFVHQRNTKNFVIRLAAQYGHLRVVELLLTDSRVDPSANYNCAILNATEWGRQEVVTFIAGFGSIRYEWKGVN
ncbi:hypothetical protein BC833DRAFT_638040 [Globomyces pollinis-pini]|nr:hypothetical protein BC833DRAFT_638040 [Globomyces pollinis-pini]